MLIKKKSLIVISVSGIVICSVLVLTLIGYVLYIKFNVKKDAMRYQALLQKIKAR